ncbi:MAG: lipopolysaccharide heptosyltransferase II [Mariprofundus sp.]|nr:lipopolysaccharide heptosyltransferase II [Mariprofundus sp.]
MKTVSHLLLMPPNWIGDAIMAQPAMRAICEYHLRHSHTEQISVCGRPWLSDLLPYLDLPGTTYQETIPKADMAFLFPNSFRSAFQCRQAGISQLIGYQGQWRKLLLSKALPHRIKLKNEHHRGFYLDIPDQLDIPVTEREVRLCIPDQAKPGAHESMQQHGLNPQQVICIAPGAQFGGAKCYPAKSYNKVVQRLAESGWQPIILGMPEDNEVGQIILKDIATPHWNAAGKTSLAEALQLIAGSRLMLCNDSGLMHVAAGLGIPTVTPFGATDPERTSPSGPHVRILYQPADCSPCLKRECTVPGHPCMANISPTLLLDACLAMLT